MNVGVSFFSMKTIPRELFVHGSVRRTQTHTDVEWHHNIKWISLALNNNT
jgi:hypothetical protein